MHAYNELYLSDAMNNLGEACDYAAYECGVAFTSFWPMFTAHPLSESFAAGQPFVVSGMSGCELALKVLAANNAVGSVAPTPAVVFDSGREYWCGWILAYYQWLSCLSFSAISQVVSPHQVEHMYSAYHEMSEDSFVRDVNAALVESLGTTSKLKLCRQRRGLTQQALSEATGISLRTLQHYEQKDKDINRAQVTTVLALARALHCNVEDLLEPPAAHGYAQMKF